MAQENIGLTDIPEELMSNILIRLPSKFVVRCKLVCKQWDSLISGPLFVSSYISRFPSSSSSSWTVVGERVKDRCIEYDLPKRICSGQDFDTLCLSIDHERKAHRRFRVLGANDGTILVGLIDRCYTGTSYKSCNLYYICNPAIRKLISLSPPSPDKVLTVEWYWGSGLVTRIENDVLESFRVVLLSPETRTGWLRFMVYASETQECNRYFVPQTSLTQHIVNKLPTVLNQMLHWVTRGGYVIAYDPYGKPDRVRAIPPPKGRATRRRDSVRCLCDVSKGKLMYLERFSVMSNGDSCVCFKMWVLEDYGSGSWCMSREWDSASIRFTHVVPVCPDVLEKSVPMFFDPFDSDILYLWYRHRVMSFDAKTRMLEAVLEFTTKGRAKNKMLPWYLAFFVELFPWTPCLVPSS